MSNPLEWAYGACQSTTALPSRVGGHHYENLALHSNAHLGDSFVINIGKCAVSEEVSVSLRLKG